MSSKTGTGSLELDLLLLFLMIAGGVSACVWYVNSPPEVVAIAVNQGLKIAFIVMVQPGMFLAYRFLTQFDQPWRWRIALSLASVVINAGVAFFLCQLLLSYV